MNTPPLYCQNLLQYTRRPTREVKVGNLGIGGENPVRVQSMITSDTRDTEACVAETLALAEVGCEIVRITAQTRVYAANLENITRGVRAAGCQVPLVADIHFKPDAAMEAAKWVEKVRVNPGNYADKKKFEVREYTNAEYAAEIRRIREQFVPLVRLCKALGRAMRIGTNHGSLSDRIMNRFGDTPLGMVESALEFAQIARDEGYHNFVFSMKASNPKVMIHAYRLLVARLIDEGPDWNYPIHLGVTEAGDGEDGRIKSAVGIGSLLADGIGDTIRVSLTEDSVHEIPVAQALVGLAMRNSGWDLQSQSVVGTSCPDATVAGTCSPSPASGHPVPSQSPAANLTTLAESIRPDWSQLQKSTSSYLPHWRIPGATYAVTFRIKDSLPISVIKEYQRQRDALMDRIAITLKSAGSRDATAELLPLRSELQTLTETLIEPALHSATGPQPLSNSELAAIVENALKFFDGQRYDLLAWSVMPNHVHVLLTPYPTHPLEKIIQSWKTHTAKEVNRILGQSGAFWQEEYFDHIVRDGEDLKHQITYILRNPQMGNASAAFTGSVFSEEFDTTDSVGTGCPDDGLGLQVPATNPPFDPYSYERRQSLPLEIMAHALGGDHTLRVVTTQERWNALAHKIAGMGDYKPEIILEKSGVLEVDPHDAGAIAQLNATENPRLITVADGLPLEPIHAFRLLAAKVAPVHPILLKDTLEPPAGETNFLHALLVASRNIGSLLCDGIGDAVLVRGEQAPGQSLRLAYNILQATGARIFKTDYVACPSCGRTLFNLQSTTQKIRAATGHLKGVRIAVMGCIVNGPGEMADADFGYVGGAPGKINLYVGKTAVKFNIPEAEAVDRLIELIREHGRWIEAPTPAAAHQEAATP